MLAEGIGKYQEYVDAYVKAENLRLVTKKNLT